MKITQSILKTIKINQTVFHMLKKSPQHLIKKVWFSSHLITAAQKFHEIECDENANNAKGFTKKLLNSTIYGIKIQDLLKEVDHFGVLDENLSIKGATKYTYSLLEFKNSVIFKTYNPGMGLGSHAKVKTIFNQTEEITHNNTKISILEAIQCYCIILNLGHLFGTFATERGLLYYDKKTNASITEQIRSKIQPLLSNETNQLIDKITISSDLFQIHSVLGFYRISLLDQTEIKNICFKIINFMNADSESSHKALWSFRRVRQVSYHELHSIIFADGSLNMTDYNNLIKSLRQDPNIGYNPMDDNNNTTQKMMKYMDEYQNITHFSSAASAQTVLEHINKYRKWWYNKKSFRNIELSDLPFIKPFDWPSTIEKSKNNYVHLLRLEIFTQNNWIEEQINWTYDHGIWENINFMMTPFPRSTSTQNMSIIDLYKKSTTSNLEINFIHFITQKLHISNKIAIEQNDPKNQNNRKTWRSISRFFIKILEEVFLKENYTCYIEPNQCDNDHVAYATIINNSQLKSEIQLLDWLPIHRKEELEPIEQIESEIKQNSYSIIILGELKIITKTNQTIGELDMAIINISNDEINLIIGETKIGKKVGTGSGQIKKLSNIIKLQSSTKTISKKDMSETEGFTYLKSSKPLNGQK
jgi:hypothetical protein